MVYLLGYRPRNVNLDVFQFIGCLQGLLCCSCAHLPAMCTFFIMQDEFTAFSFLYLWHPELSNIAIARIPGPFAGGHVFL